MQQYKNPVIPGYNPDPSIVRVGEDFYLVTSSFEFFPGVPIYHSKNLVNWELINHCLTDEQQLPLAKARNSGGIFAPTIRYHDGLFYMITTNVDNGGNFLVYTDDVRGKWSAPVWIKHKGIDPSLLFDQGKVYFCSTSLQDGKAGIALYEMNPQTGQLFTQPQIITYGSGGKYPEAPHLYHIGDKYYLMIAEGGTEYGHMETIFRADNPYGPFKACPHDPILSHRSAMGSPIQATGHADIVEDQNGNWWMVFLGIRPLEHAMLHNLGRETFLAPVTWNSEGWPVIEDAGVIKLDMNGPLPQPALPVALSFEDDFSSVVLKQGWYQVRNPVTHRYQHSDMGLILIAGDETISDKNPTGILIRQQAFNISAQTELSIIDLPESAKVGLTAYYNTDYHYEAYLTRCEDKIAVCLDLTVHSIQAQVACVLLSPLKTISFKVVADQRYYTFYFRTEQDWIQLGKGSTAGLCTEGTQTMTFTGTFLGIFAAQKALVCFTSFQAKQLPTDYHIAGLPLTENKPKLIQDENYADAPVNLP